MAELKEDWPDINSSISGSGDVPLRLRFQAVEYSIFAGTRNNVPSDSEIDITLPFPKNLVRNNAINYGIGETETGNMFDITTGGIWETIKTGGGLFSALKDMVGTGKVLGQRPMDMRDSIYQGANFRVHGFTWKMIPKTPKCPDKIRRVCKLFQNNAYPRLSAYESASRVVHPYIWHISKMVGARRSSGGGEAGKDFDFDPWLFGVLPSVLTKVQIDTTPEGSYGYTPEDSRDKYPAITTLTLEFQELEPAINDDGELRSRSQTK